MNRTPSRPTGGTNARTGRIPASALGRGPVVRVAHFVPLAQVPDEVHQAHPVRAQAEPLAALDLPVQVVVLPVVQVVAVPVERAGGASVNAVRRAKVACSATPRF